MRYTPSVIASLLIALFCGLGREPSARAAHDPLVVIVSPATALRDVSMGKLRRVFGGEPTDDEAGARLIPLNQALNAPDREWFDRAVLGLTPEVVGRFWVDRRIRDQYPPPRTVPSPELALRIVMSLKGAIAYVRSDLVNQHVRVLTIDGREPGEAGYLLSGR